MHKTCMDDISTYGIETKRVNEAVKNNPDMFPYGILFELGKYEKTEVTEKNDHLNKLKFSKVAPEYLRSARNHEPVPCHFLPLSPVTSGSIRDR